MKNISELEQLEIQRNKSKRRASRIRKIVIPLIVIVIISMLLGRFIAIKYVKNEERRLEAMQAEAQQSQGGALQTLLTWSNNISSGGDSKDSSLKDLDISFIGMEKHGITYYHVYFLFKNENDTDVTVKFDDLLLNGVSIDGFGTEKITANSELTTYITGSIKDIVDSQIGTDINDITIKYHYDGESSNVRQLVLENINYDRSDSKPSEKEPDDASNSKSSVEKDDDKENTETKESTENTTVNTDEEIISDSIPEHLSFEFTSTDNSGSYIKFNFKVTNNSDSSCYVGVKNYNMVDGIMVNGTKYNNTIDAGFSSIVSFMFSWNRLKCANIEELHNIVFTMYVKESKESEDWNYFYVPIQYDDGWKIVNLSDVDLTRAEYTENFGELLYPYGEGNVKVIFSRLYNHSGTIEFFFTIENGTNQKIYFKAPSTQYVNGVKMRSDYIGLIILKENEKASIDQQMYWSILKEGGITNIEEINFTFYVSDDKESADREEIHCTVSNEGDTENPIWKIEKN